MLELPAILLLLAVLTSGACCALLFRGYARSRVRLLLWSALCFVFFTLNNVILFADLVMLPEMDLRLYRIVLALAGIACLLYAFIWEAE